MNKIFLIAIVGLLLVVCVSVYYHNNSKRNIHDIVYNPATGEQWNSVEEYVNKNDVVSPREYLRDFIGPIKSTDKYKEENSND